MHSEHVTLVSLSTSASNNTIALDSYIYKRTREENPPLWNRTAHFNSTYNWNRTNGIPARPSYIRKQRFIKIGMGYKIQMITTHIEGDDKGCPLGGRPVVSIKSWINARLLCGIESLGRWLTKVEFFLYSACDISVLHHHSEDIRYPTGIGVKSLSRLQCRMLSSAVEVSQSKKWPFVGFVLSLVSEFSLSKAIA